MGREASGAPLSGAVHGNIKTGEIDESNVRSGIEGALAVVTVIRRKLSAA